MKKKSSKSPTSRSLEHLRKLGFIADVVERFIRFPPPGHRKDFLGCIDVIGVRQPLRDKANNNRLLLRSGKTIGVQCCAGSTHSAHIKKCLAEPRLLFWLKASPTHTFEVWSWSQRGAAGKRKLWTLRRQPIIILDGMLCVQAAS
jgi:hypothetical protein